MLVQHSTYVYSSGTRTGPLSAVGSLEHGVQLKTVKILLI